MITEPLRCTLLGRLVIWFWVCNLYFFYVLLQPRYSQLPMQSSVTDKMSFFSPAT